MLSVAVNERNSRARNLVIDFLEDLKKNPLSDIEIKESQKEIGLLNDLIPIKQKGFRGIVLTAIVGKTLEPNYSPLENFYSCHPRPLFEQAIFYALQEYKIPCGKSDPLNVAKNINKLDYDWANGRRPESAARAAVDYIKIITEDWENEKKRNKRIRLYFGKLIEYANVVNEKNVPFPTSKKISSIVLAYKLAKFSVDCSEGGEITQFIIGLLLRILREPDPRFKAVKGVDESVFGTNTTGKKPADLWEVFLDGTIGNLYEVTVKPIDQKRLDDCVDSLVKLSISEKEVTFICRIPEDVKQLSVTKRSLNYRGIRFQFLDVESFILDTFSLFSENQREKYILALQEKIFDHNRHIKTKEYWEQNFT